MRFAKVGEIWQARDGTEVKITSVSIHVINGIVQTGARKNKAWSSPPDSFYRSCKFLK